MLAQEPWCFHPEQIASLTDWQIEHLFVQPAVDRFRRLEAGRSGERAAASNIPATSDAPPDPSHPRFRGWVIAQFMAMGMSRAEAERQYEQQARNQGAGLM